MDAHVSQRFEIRPVHLCGNCGAILSKDGPDCCLAPIARPALTLSEAVELLRRLDGEDEGDGQSAA